MSPLHVGRRAGGGAAAAATTGRVRKMGTAASSSATKSVVVGRKIRAKFVDLRGMLGEEEYRRLVEPAKATAEGWRLIYSRMQSHLFTHAFYAFCVHTTAYTCMWK